MAIVAGAVKMAPLAGEVIVTEGGVGVAVVVTLSNVAVASVPLMWLDTARPASTFVDIVNVSLPTVVQVVPSADSYAVMTLPARVSFTQRGAVDMDPAVLTLVLPSATRRWNARPFAEDTSMKACADEGESEPRIITPAFTHAA